MPEKNSTFGKGERRLPEYAKDSMERMPYEFYLEKYRQADPRVISSRLGIPFDWTEKTFTMVFLGNVYDVTHPGFTISYREAENACYILKDNVYAKILVLRYFLNSSIFPHNGEFRTYQELPSGDLYYRQFQGRCLSRLIRKYGNRLDIMGKIMDSLGATQIHQGDVGYELEIFEELYVRFLFWEGDDEFPPSAQILFSSNFPAAFGAYDLAEIGDLCINLFGEIEKRFVVGTARNEKNT